MGIKAGEGAEKETGNGHQDKFKRDENCPPKRKILGPFRLIDMVKNKYDQEKGQGQGQNQRGKLGWHIAQRCPAKSGIEQGWQG